MVLLVENVHQRSSHCLLLSSYLSSQPPSTGTSHTLRHENSASSTSGHQRGKCQGSGFWFCGCFDERLASGSQPLPFACQTVKWLSSLHPPSLGPVVGLSTPHHWALIGSSLCDKILHLPLIPSLLPASALSWWKVKYIELSFSPSTNMSGIDFQLSLVVTGQNGFGKFTW